MINSAEITAKSTTAFNLNTGVPIAPPSSQNETMTLPGGVISPNKSNQTVNTVQYNFSSNSGAITTNPNAGATSPAPVLFTGAIPTIPSVLMQSPPLSPINAVSPVSQPAQPAVGTSPSANVNADSAAAVNAEADAYAAAEYQNAFSSRSFQPSVGQRLEDAGLAPPSNSNDDCCCCRIL